ncbi:hypothetical protein D7S86_02810 [Pararobbsia silviterrae]|uniref:Aldose 1-epimerase n=1 Tax=Pararobbsia silviterrae TaxID=1792498 RepID=A0A494Y9S2_9BURK|nr:hypothetical protein D7S86_02810 [Pararobbsia silviterrae]
MQGLGGMLAPLMFELGDGRRLQCMQIAPWADTEQAERLPGILRRLRGEWPCVPFGRPDTPSDLPPGWRGLRPDDTWPHGFASNHVWHCIDAGRDHLTIAIDYPEDAAIARLERRFAVVPDAPRLDIELVIHARRPVRVPVALHPTFRVPRDPGRLVVEPAAHGGIHTYPVQAERHVSRLRPNATARALAQMPSDGATIDLTHLPLPFKTEELLQITDIGVRDVDAQVVLRYLDEDVRVGLGWDTHALPDVMLWVSNGGRDGEPWSGRHYALGVEPVNGLFDLGRVAAVDASHALASRTGLVLDPAHPSRIRYHFAAW